MKLIKPSIEFLEPIDRETTLKRIEVTEEEYYVCNGSCGNNCKCK